MHLGTSLGTLPRALLAGGLLLLVTLVTYLPALDGQFIWDDNAHVTVPALRSLTGFWRIWTDPRATQQYYPLTHSAFWLAYQLWGVHPVGYHLVNVVLHGLGALLLWRILARLAVPGAWFGAAIFALHPVNVESVPGSLGALRHCGACRRHRRLPVRKQKHAITPVLER